MTILTVKQQRFVSEYLSSECLNATEAAIRAGYAVGRAKVSASENLRKPNVAKAIAQAMQERSLRTGITQDYVLNSLKQVAERCLQAEPVMARGQHSSDDEGNYLWTFNAAGANKALELLGKHLGIFSDKLEVSGKVDIAKAIEAGRKRANGNAEVEANAQANTGGNAEANVNAKVTID